MFGFGKKIKDFAAQKMLQQQLKNLPPEQQEAVMKAFQENPEFFQKIAEEIKALQDQGKNQMAAAMEVMRKNQGELQKIFAGGMPTGNMNANMKAANDNNPQQDKLAA